MDSDFLGDVGKRATFLPHRQDYGDLARKQRHSLLTRRRRNALGTEFTPQHAIIDPDLPGNVLERPPLSLQGRNAAVSCGSSVLRFAISTSFCRWAGQRGSLAMYAVVWPRAWRAARHSSAGEHTAPGRVLPTLRSSPPQSAARKVGLYDCIQSGSSKDHHGPLPGVTRRSAASGPVEMPFARSSRCSTWRSTPISSAM